MDKDCREKFLFARDACRLIANDESVVFVENGDLSFLEQLNHNDITFFQATR